MNRDGAVQYVQQRTIGEHEELRAHRIVRAGGRNFRRFGLTTPSSCGAPASWTKARDQGCHLRRKVNRQVWLVFAP
jgi:hypothetical protein